MAPFLRRCADAMDLCSTVGPQSSSGPQAGDSRGLFPRPCHFRERGAPSDLGQAGLPPSWRVGTAGGCDFHSPVSVLPWTSPEVLGKSHLQPESWFPDAKNRVHAHFSVTMSIS